jgi:hypothetical protein
MQAAGLSTRDYFLTQLTLLLAYPVVQQKRQSRPVTTTDVSADSVSVIEANWSEVDTFMRAFTQRVNAERKGRAAVDGLVYRATRGIAADEPASLTRF